MVAVAPGVLMPGLAGDCDRNGIGRCADLQAVEAREMQRAAEQLRDYLASHGLGGAAILACKLVKRSFTRGVQ